MTGCEEANVSPMLVVSPTVWADLSWCGSGEVGASREMVGSPAGGGTEREGDVSVGISLFFLHFVSWYKTGEVTPGSLSLQPTDTSSMPNTSWKNIGELEMVWVFFLL